MSESLGAYPAEQLTAPVDSASPGLFTSVAGSPSLLRPPPLKLGDTIGIVAPSYAPHGGWLLRGAQAMKEAGYEVILEPDIDRVRHFQQSEDRKRARNLTEMWVNPDVKAVICGTGGYGAVRILPYLDADLFRQNPKSFVGYSDITALHLWMMRRAGLRVFHGPTLDDLTPRPNDPTLLSVLTALTVPRPDIRLGFGLARAVRPGRATGRLTGGNLSLVQQSIGTPYEIDTRDAILFLEEIHDPMSVCDERLLHLRAAGLLRHVRGIVFGQLSVDRCEEDEFQNFLLDLLSDLDVPILMDFPAGHETPNLTIPLGTEMELVTDDLTGWLAYREDALASPEDRRRLSLI